MPLKPLHLKMLRLSVRPDIYKAIKDIQKTVGLTDDDIGVAAVNYTMAKIKHDRKRAEDAGKTVPAKIHSVVDRVREIASGFFAPKSNIIHMPNEE